MESIRHLCGRNAVVSLLQFSGVLTLGVLIFGLHGCGSESSGAGQQDSNSDVVSDAGLLSDSADDTTNKVDSAPQWDSAELVAQDTSDILDLQVDDVPDIETDTLQQPVDGGGDSADLTTDASSESGFMVDGLFNPGALTEDEALFPLGVQSGDPTYDGVMLWTRFIGEGGLRLAVFADAYKVKPGEVAFEDVAVVADGGFVHVLADNLNAYTNYRYCFYVVGEDGNATGARSQIGFVRTAPDPEALLPVVFGATSCINENFMPYDTLEQAGSDDLDFFILAGDLVYADGSETLDDYRSVWTHAWEDPGYQKLFRTTPNFATWDDHEVNNNWDPETIDTAQLEAATQAFFEVLAIRPQEEPGRVWRSYRWGKTAEVFVLDCRSERRPSQDLYISTEQMTWLKDGLLQSDAIFKIIVNSVPITDMPPWFISENDRWEGYPAQREEILDYIADEVDGVLWITGDFHFGGVMKIGAGGSKHEDMYEVMVGPAAQFANPLWVGVKNAPSVQGQFPFLTGTMNYTRFTLNPDSDPPNVTVEFLTGSGSVIHTQELVP